MKWLLSMLAEFVATRCERSIKIQHFRPFKMQSSAKIVVSVDTSSQRHIGNPGDESLLLSTVRLHIEHTGRLPYAVATDRGYSSGKNEAALTELGIKRISIPTKGKKTQKRQTHERQRWFRRLQAWRAGGEGTISILKRKYGLGRSLLRGHRGVSIWVGFGILTYNLRRLAAMN